MSENEESQETETEETQETQANLFDSIISEAESTSDVKKDNKEQNQQEDSGKDTEQEDAETEDKDEDKDEDESEAETEDDEEAKAKKEAESKELEDTTNGALDSLKAENEQFKQQIQDMSSTLGQIQQKEKDAEAKASAPYYKQILDATPEQIKKQLEYDAQGNHLGYDVDGVQMKLTGRVIEDAIEHLKNEISPLINQYQTVINDRKAEAKLVTETKGDINKYGAQIKEAFSQKFPKGLPKDTDKWVEIEKIYKVVRSKSLQKEAQKLEKHKQAAKNQQGNTKLEPSPAKKSGTSKQKKSGFDEIIAELG